VLELSPDAFYGDTTWMLLTRAGIHFRLGDSERGRAVAEDALRNLAAQAGEESEADLQSRLGLVYAMLGRADEAARAAERSVALLPIAKDAMVGTLLVYRLACVQAQVGRRDDAVATLRTLLTLPFYVSPSWLRIDPNFEQLRSHPDFRRMVS
jgi:tetratricopeptide (TPR) repeat protein